jgi:hypothetical protein
MGAHSLVISARSVTLPGTPARCSPRSSRRAGAYLLRGARHNDSAREGASITPSKPADGNFALYRGPILPAGHREAVVVGFEPPGQVRSAPPACHGPCRMRPRDRAATRRCRYRILQHKLAVPPTAFIKGFLAPYKSERSVLHMRVGSLSFDRGHQATSDSSCSHMACSRNWSTCWQRAHYGTIDLITAQRLSRSAGSKPTARFLRPRIFTRKSRSLL